MKQEQVIELLLQSLEHERGGIKLYETALKCVQNDDLREEWEKYLEETRNHERILTEVCGALEIDPEAQTPGRAIAKMMGASLVEAMLKAKATATAASTALPPCLRISRPTAVAAGWAEATIAFRATTSPGPAGRPPAQDQTMRATAADVRTRQSGLFTAAPSYVRPRTAVKEERDRTFAYSF